MLKLGMQINITLTSLKKNTKIQLSDNKCVCDGKVKTLNCQEFIARILNIVAIWKPQMINKDIIDGLSYKVEVLNGDKTYKFDGQNCFPDNFIEFENVIKEIENC